MSSETTRPPRTMEEEIALSVKSIPFVRAIGVELVEADKHACHLQVPLEPRFCQDAGNSNLSAGLIAGVLDQLGSGTLTAYFGQRHAKATLSMSLGFARDLSAEGALDIIGRAHFDTGATGSVELNAKASDGRVLAHGLVEFMIGAYPGAGTVFSAHDHSRKADRSRFEPEVVEAESFGAWMGLEIGGDEAQLPWANRLTGSTGPVVAFHGGVVAAAAIGQAQARATALGPFHLAHFTMEYLRAAKDQTLTVRSEVIRETRRTLVLRTEILQEDGARHVATATSRFVKAD